MKSVRVQADLTIESPSWLVRFQADGQVGTLSLTPSDSSCKKLLEAALVGGRKLDDTAGFLEASGLTAIIELMGVRLGCAGQHSRPGLLSAILGYRRTQIELWGILQAFCKLVTRGDRL
ncbi:MAG: hypothetical protein KC777_09690 [Cyanobacteria bacterium HKST-UBA02]|nr:hypothetical protein [Cyanobacteria bacterium HKST-UBA02]